ncbi:sensor histidine kinase [Thermocatellispora tengchongensis]|uniref:sensor histidine kinase n=1 Tax=Thermocatellispora tengchongensis TaxID=1073253 RepID=UPI00338A80F9
MIRRLSEIAMVCWLVMLLLIDVVVTASYNGGRTGFVPVVPLLGAVGVIAFVVRRRWRAHGFALLLGLSMLVSIVVGSLEAPLLPGTAETAAMLVLTIGVLRWVEPIGRAALLAGGSMVALLTMAGARQSDDAGLAIGFMLLMLWATAASVGAYLRYQYERRRAATQAVRRAERLELARELHDLVAHHITGIVVQAQAARTVAEQKPEAVLPALDAIAGAGADALASMRRLVSVLRAQDEASRTSGTTLADLRTLVERFSAGGPTVTFEIGQGIADDTLAPEVMTTLHRILQESLTNIRRHAPGTGWVEIDLRLAEGKVRLRVRNYGSGSDARLSRLGGGFGLVGMAERVEALGGRLWAGRTADGAWEVLAEF